ncbi:unnamed protein product [Nesidiocoris tenuis]|uniref:Uncharacterized protein n=1 Tax=Nesidiocoris tenuis TaxID=355587 RepID=A0A6H5H0T9_9HEMI|nr:unnamed protein product [Nesidiocoris tenuis]
MSTKTPQNVLRLGHGNLPFKGEQSVYSRSVFDKPILRLLSSPHHITQHVNHVFLHQLPRQGQETQRSIRTRVGGIPVLALL